MPVQIKAVDQVPEASINDVIGDFANVHANIITAINDGKGTFSVEGTFIRPAPPGGAADVITRIGKMSTFGGPHDTGVRPDEGLALYDAANMGTAPAGMFLPASPPGTTGLARRLDPSFNYLASRWEYAVTPASFLRQSIVKVSANGKTVDVHPADWGPNIATGRVADLSPAVASALGLNTGDTCTVVIPLPGGAAIPAPAGAPVVGVDPAAIDAMAFPADMTRKLVVVTTFADKTYWVVNVTGPNEGGQTLMLQDGANSPQLLRSDSVILPITDAALVPELVAAELNKAVQKQPDAAVGPAGQAPQAGDDINAKMFATARNFVGHVTNNVPGTDNGNLACAWAVNEVTRLALGKPISSDGGKNGLSTDGIFEALNAHHTQLGGAADAKPGVIIIAPTKGNNHGHVGIVGTTSGSVGDTQIFSNRSVPGVFAQNFTIGSFTSRYTQKGLDVLFFALKADQFTAPGP
jgi:hypothetical protein